MKALPVLLLILLCGCETMKKIFPPDPYAGKEHLDPQRVDWWDRSIRDRHGLRAYHVKVEASHPGVRIEVDGEHVTTLEGNKGEILLWADANGTFRNNQVVVVKAYPGGANQLVQALSFSSAGQQTFVPRSIYFDMRLDKVTPVQRYESTTINK